MTVTQTPLLPRIAFVAACLFFAFFGGFVTSHFEVFPHSLFAPGLDQAAQLVRGQPVHHQRPGRYDFSGVVAYGRDGTPLPPDQVDEGEGCVLLTSFWPDYDGRPGIRLVDRRGRTLHHWDVDLDAIWPEPPYDDGAEAFYGTEHYLHGSYLFENGDVLFNVEFLGLVRMNPRGEVVWRLDRHTHHSVARTEDGDFWVCEMRWITDQKDALTRFYGLEVPFAEDRVLKVSADGEVLQEVSVLELLCGTELRSMLFQGGVGSPTRSRDPLHLNDVEELPRALAADFPTLAAGDLVVSLFQPNLVMVFDPATREVKWSQSTPLIHQHDPDFRPGGWISVFNNNSDETPTGIVNGGSQLLAYQPHSGAQRGLYPERLDASLQGALRGDPLAPSGHERRFYTPVGGKAQQLSNGHWLITEAVTGRVFEVDERGHTVWEWCQERCANGVDVSEVLEGTWYPYSREQIAAWPRD